MTSKPIKEWTLASRETVFQGYYQVDKLKFRHSLFGGGTSELIDREMFVRGNVAAVLAYDPISDSIALVEQFRIGAMNQPDNPWLLEVIAGMIEKGEEPEQVAIRESKEEAGLNLSEVRLIRRYLASPGCTPEEVFIYYAETDLSQVQGVHGLEEEGEEPEEVAIRESKEEAGLNLSEVQLIRRYLASPGCTPEEVFIYYAETDLSQVQGVHGLEEEGEDIQVHVVRANDAIAMLEDGRIKNAISIIALQWFQHQRLLKQVGRPD